MFVGKDTATVFFDVDDTLIKWYADDDEKEACGIPILGELPAPHRRHVALLKKFKMRGYTVVVWSQGGSEHAEHVVKALGLESYVDAVLNKPVWYVDDLKVNEFLPEDYRIWEEDT